MIEYQINQFVKRTAQELCSFLSAQKKNILVVSYYPTYRKHYGDLIRKLKKKYNVITIVDRVMDDDFEKSGHHNVLFPWRVIENGNTYYLNVDIPRIDLILTADQVGYDNGRIDREFLSKSAKRVYFPHSLMEATGVSDCVDYILMPSKIVKKEYQKALKNKKVKLLEAGYPKLDIAIKKYKYESKNTITYAPSLRYVDATRKANLNLFSGFDCNMIEWLLENTSYNISFRAHPINFQNNHFYYELIKAKWQNETRVSFDEKAGNEFCNYSDYLITDYSTSAFTYSFISGRTSFFYKPFYFGGGMERYVSSVSVGGANSFYQLKKQMKSYEKESDKYHNKIINFRDKNIYNVGNSEEVILKMIEMILEGDL